MEKIGFLETFNAKAGIVEKSNSRRMANIIILGSLLFCGILLLTGCYVAFKTNETDGLIGIAAAIGTLFTTTSGVAMGFLFFQKKTENNGGAK
jgi:uncharacterized membrane protein